VVQSGTLVLIETHPIFSPVISNNAVLKRERIVFVYSLPIEEKLYHSIHTNVDVEYGVRVGLSDGPLWDVDGERFDFSHKASPPP
jgi:hypothetical protein